MSKVAVRIREEDYGVVVEDGPDEWIEVRDGLFQHRECSRVFKGELGVWDVDGVAHVGLDGVESVGAVKVEMPYRVRTLVLEEVVVDD